MTTTTMGSSDSDQDTPQPYYALRKRRKSEKRDDSNARNIELLKEYAHQASKIVVFSGSGLSATSGMSTFSTKGGLYDMARQKYQLSDGKNLFTYSFYKRRKQEAEAFFVDIQREARAATPAPGHVALARLSEAGRLSRHYTLNIDGLATRVGMDVWDPESNVDGCTVEMHGSVHHLVCTGCGTTTLMSEAHAASLSRHVSVRCDVCKDSSLRFKVMMYDDDDGEYITPDDVMDLMEEDVKGADMIVWVGISFQQSASTSYFRKVRHWLQEDDKHQRVVQAVINPSDEALWNVLTASSNQGELNILEVLGTADHILPMLL